MHIIAEIQPIDGDELLIRGLGSRPIMADLKRWSIHMRKLDRTNVFVEANSLSRGNSKKSGSEASPYQQPCLDGESSQPKSKLAPIPSLYFLDIYFFKNPISEDGKVVTNVQWFFAYEILI